MRRRQPVALLDSAERIVVTGAGSSYYLAQSVAAVARAVLGRTVVATPLSELILRPEGALVSAAGAGREPVVIISRSGSTSEAVTVAEQMRDAGRQTIAVTCRADSPLAAAAGVTLVSPAGDEEAIVMTRSFASMLALLLGVVARRRPRRVARGGPGAGAGTLAGVGGRGGGRAPAGRHRLEPRRRPGWWPGLRHRRRSGASS